MNISNRVIKILLVTRPIAPPWDEASKNFAYNLATNMPDFEFGLLTNGILENLPQNIKQHPIYTSNENNFIQKLKLIINLRKIAKSYDLVHCLFTPTKLNSFLLSNLLSNKKTIQTIATLREDLYSDEKIKKLMFGNLLATYSDYSKNRLITLGLKNAERIYPGIDLNYFSPAPKDLELLKKYEMRADDFVVTYPGEYTRLEAINDITDMIFRYLNIFKENNIKFILACRLKNNADILKKEEIMERMKSCGAADAVIFINTFSEMPKLYNLSDAIIFPVREMHGKFDVPLAVIEPMACEKPVIVSDLPILAEFAKPEHSVIIEKGNVTQLKDAILDLRRNPERCIFIGKNGRKFIGENFDIKKAAQNYREIYNGL
ncbi:MAG: glycosyltransferase family 4 protein [Parcubacteria group bacterium]